MGNYVFEIGSTAQSAIWHPLWVDDQVLARVNLMKMTKSLLTSLSSPLIRVTIKQDSNMTICTFFTWLTTGTSVPRRSIWQPLGVPSIWVNVNADKMWIGDSVGIKDPRTLTGSEGTRVPSCWERGSLMSHNCDNQEVETLPEAPRWSSLKGVIKTDVLQSREMKGKRKSSFDVAVSERICSASISGD